MQMQKFMHPQTCSPQRADTHRKLTSMYKHTAAHFRALPHQAELNSSSAPTPVPNQPSRDSQARRSAPGPKEGDSLRDSSLFEKRRPFLGPSLPPLAGAER